jgi:hypothetical protein
MCSGILSQQKKKVGEQWVPNCGVTAMMIPEHVIQKTLELVARGL